MTQPWTPKRPTVELRPSRIRREPPPRPADKQSVLPDDTESDTWPVVIGILVFAIAITVLIFWVSDYTSRDRPPPVIMIDAS